MYNKILTKCESRVVNVTGSCGSPAGHVYATRPATWINFEPVRAKSIKFKRSVSAENSTWKHKIGLRSEERVRDEKNYKWRRKHLARMEIQNGTLAAHSTQRPHCRAAFDFHSNAACYVIILQKSCSKCNDDTHTHSKKRAPEKMKEK